MVYRTPTAMLQHNDRFASKAAAQAARLGDIGAVLFIEVMEDGESYRYRPTLGPAFDLKGSDDTLWVRTSVGQTEIVEVVSDWMAAFTTLTQDQGAWTPTLAWFDGGGSFSYTLQEGRWIRIGNKVQVDFSLIATLTTLGTGVLQVKGLGAGQRPMAGSLPGYMITPAINDNFAPAPFAAGYAVSWTGASEHGVFSYYSAGYENFYVDTVTGTPIGNGSAVTWLDGGGKLMLYDPAAAPGTGRLHIVQAYGALPTGLITGAGWTANGPATPGTSTFGQSSGQRFAAAANFTAGEQIVFNATGIWRLA